MYSFYTLVLTLTLICGLMNPVVAAGDTSGLTDIARPETRVLLTISGNIERSNSLPADAADDPSANGPSVELDLAMLEALGPEKVITKTPWTEGDTEFEGILVSKLLDFVGANSSHLTLTGLDGYSADIRKIDFNRYPIIIAFKRDSNYLTLRSLGPLWLMFPFNQYPELINEMNKSAAVWQLTSIVVR